MLTSSTITLKFLVMISYDRSQETQHISPYNCHGHLVAQVMYRKQQSSLLSIFKRSWSWHGFRNASQPSQRYINSALRDLDFAFVYLDDIIIASSSEEEYQNQLDIVFVFWVISSGPMASNQHQRKLRRLKNSHYLANIVITQILGSCEQLLTFACLCRRYATYTLNELLKGAKKRRTNVQYHGSKKPG